jgi:hypothetical protein
VAAVIVGCPRLQGRKGGMKEEIQLVRGRERWLSFLGLSGGFRIAFIMWFEIRLDLVILIEGVWK